MKRALLVAVIVQPVVVVVDDDGDGVADEVSVTPLRVPASQWPGWVTDQWPDQWASLRERAVVGT